MTFKNIVIALLGGLVVVAIASCRSGRETEPVRITVTVDTNAQLVLTIENATAHVVLFDDPRFSRSTRFDWELSAGQEIVAQGGKGGVVRDPLLAGHLSTGPVDIGPDRPFKCNLSKYYPDLKNGMLITNASSLLWYCRVWDETATNWIQACGIVRLR